MFENILNRHITSTTTKMVLFIAVNGYQVYNYCMKCQNIVGGIRDIASYLI